MLFLFFCSKIFFTDIDNSRIKLINLEKIIIDNRIINAINPYTYHIVTVKFIILYIISSKIIQYLLIHYLIPKVILFLLNLLLILKVKIFQL